MLNAMQFFSSIRYLQPMNASLGKLHLISQSPRAGLIFIKMIPIYRISMELPIIQIIYKLLSRTVSVSQYD